MGKRENKRDALCTDAGRQRNRARRAMTPAETVLSRLHGVRDRGRGQWAARCPAHDDRSPSLSIKERDDGALLLHCFGGCEAGAVVGALGLAVGDLFPPSGSSGKPSRLRMPAADALAILSREAAVLYVVGSGMHRRQQIAPADFERLAVAVQRVGQIAEAAR